MISVLQVLALDIGTDLLPALALGAERPEPGVMQRPPRRQDARLLDRRRARAGRSASSARSRQRSRWRCFPIGAALFFGWPGTRCRRPARITAVLSTMVFAAIVAMQMANAFECRSNPASLFSIGPLSNRLLVGAVAIEALILLAFVYLPPLQRVLGHHPLDLRQWALVLLTPFLLLGAEEARKAIVRARAASVR